MEPITLATAAVAALAPYLGKAAEKFATAAGDAAWKKASELYDALKSRLASHPAAAEALDDLAQAPTDVDIQGALRQQLKKLIANDPEFARTLASLTEAATPPVSANFQNDIHGNVGNINQAGSIGTLNIGGKQ